MRPPSYPEYCLSFSFFLSLFCFYIFIVSVKIPFGFAGAHGVVVLPPPHIAPERLVRLSRGFTASAGGQTSRLPPLAARGGPWGLSAEALGHGEAVWTNPSK